MMYITIGTDELWTTGIWQDALNSRWEDLMSIDWQAMKDGDRSFILIESFNVVQTIEAPSTAFFKVIDVLNQWEWSKGDQVLIENEDGTIFAGFVDQITELLFAMGMKIHEVSCIDFHYVTDKRLVGRAWVDDRPDEVVQDIFDDYLSAEGITVGQIDTADTDIPNVLFDYITISAAMDRMAEYAGFTWYISEEKKLYFVNRSDFTAPWSLQEEDNEVENALHSSVRKTRLAPEYRNRQIIKAGKDTTSTQSEDFKGDGSQRTYVVAYPIAEAPTITVGGTGKTVGIRGVDTGKDWYWSKSTSEVNQDLSASPVGSGVTINVSYKGMFPIISITMDQDAIDLLELTEGGSGIVDSVEERPELTTTAEAKDRGNSLLANYAVIGTKLEYKSINTEVMPVGVMQTVDIPSLNMADTEMLIIGNDITFDGSLMLQHITGIIGPVIDYWTKVFVKIAAAARARLSDQTAAESAVTVTEAPFHKDWLETDWPNPWKSILVSSAPTPATAGVVAFDWTDDAFKYLVLYWYTGGVDTEFYRVAITSRTSSTYEAKALETVIARVASAYGNEHTISAVGLWGGDSCSGTAGSGIELSKHAYSHTKNVNEILQITFEQHKWSA
jgi:hypothetical protein